jgi:hypothetical protein
VVKRWPAVHAPAHSLTHAASVRQPPRFLWVDNVPTERRPPASRLDTRRSPHSDTYLQPLRRPLDPEPPPTHVPHSAKWTSPARAAGAWPARSSASARPWTWRRSRGACSWQSGSPSGLSCSHTSSSTTPRALRSTPWCVRRRRSRAHSSPTRVCVPAARLPSPPPNP